MADYLATAPPPSWIETGAKITSGLDLLGLRNSVQTIGLRVLNGVTTISPTVRYISLHAWIARRYAEARLPGSWGSFREFAGRIEAGVAIGNLMVDRETTGLVGSEGATALVDSTAKQFQLKPLVKQLAVAIYSGPSEQLGISFASDSGIPGLTKERGMVLAQLVDESLGRTSFARALRKNPHQTSFSRAVLKELGTGFSLLDLPIKEMDLLVDCLIPDLPRPNEFCRHATYGLLLELAEKLEKIPSEDEFFALVLGDKNELPSFYQNWLDRWLLYLMRDCLAVGHEAVLAAVIAELAKAEASPSGVQRDALMKSLIAQDDQLTLPFSILGVGPKSKRQLDRPLGELAEELRAATTPRITGRLNRWKGNVNEQALILLGLDGGVGSFTVLAMTWLLVRERIDRSVDLSPEDRDLLSHQGNNRIGIDQVVLPLLSRFLEQGSRATIRDACYELGVYTVEQHLNTAWTRLALDPTKDVAVLSADGMSWHYRKPFSADRTASRLPQAIGWLLQLSLIDAGGCTKRGKAALTRIRKTLGAQGPTQ
jgi:hypothetical protein